ncbi:hypothetical protein HYALB_00009395 [Hymenoscyphus albidus]|uniref:Uncharacterized protein n=2 Tax=Hymenoscyphus TaxID=5182 RepID=A0A9N9KRT9_9HELO|nr:hypothetical protein HYFRA_00008983 [Hymenoscyphus fraxineus]CAG8975815.1 hypothetical protein HYALB_00009395 [Hymenoscyphus albidus]
MSPLPKVLDIVSREAINLGNYLSSRDEIGQATQNDAHPGISHPELSKDPMANPQIPFPMIIILIGIVLLGIIAGMTGSWENRNSK